MLAQLKKPTNDFFVLARYLVNGDERPPNPDRVAWILTRNLPTDDPELVAALMTATAEQSRRCSHACYHAIIAWAEEERPSAEIMQQIARRTLDMAGLAEHQAFIMGHGDKPHAHLHMMINRVHPVTGRAWSTSHDYRRFDRIMKHLAEEHGFQYVPGHAFEPELTDDRPKGPNSNATYAAKRGANTHRRQWSRKAARQYAARLGEQLGMASTGDDIEALLAEDGLTLEPKGTGLVAGDAASYVKLSALGLTASAKDLQKRLGRHPSSTKRHHRGGNRSRPKAHHRSIWTVDAIDIARMVGSRDDLLHAVQEAVRERKARLAGKPLMDQLMEELKEQLKAGTSLKPPRTKPRRSQASARDKRRCPTYRER